MTKKIMIAVILLATGIYANAIGDKSITTSSQLTTVTVYRSGAEMTHTASATLKQGNNELIIEGISNQLDMNSVQVKTPSAVTIMGIEFSTNYLVPTEKTARIKILEDSLERVQKEADKINLSLTNATDLLEVLKANRDIKGSQTGVSVAELMKLMDYYKAKSTELQAEIAQWKEKKKKINELADKINSQLQEEQNKNNIKAGRLILQLSAAMAGKFDFTLSYIAQNAFWTPFYDVRVENTQSPLKVIYKAKVTQTTGIDWKQVKLSLSTSMPTQWGNAPILESWFLGYINPVVNLNKKLAMNTIGSVLQGRAAGVSLDEVRVVGYSKRVAEDKEVDAPSTPIYVVNGNIMDQSDFGKINPSSIKKIETLKDESATSIYGSRAAAGAIIVTLKDGLEDYVSVADNTLNVSFDIDMPYDVPSNGKEQTATLKSMDVPAFYKHYTVPKLDKDAYLLAEVAGWEKLNLLPGNANIIVEGTYIGKSFIDPNSTQDTLNLTLGRDKRIVVKRDKLIDFSSVKFLGSNKLQKFTYELTIKNNKSEAANIQLKDQFPISTNKEVEVELLDNGGADVNKDLGILNWKLALAPNEVKKIRFTYTVRYPKDKTLNL